MLCSDTVLPLPQLDSVLSRLLQGEPVQYVFSHTLWHGLDLLLDGSTLIPRPETAELVDILLADTVSLASRRLSLIDACTGSGCIALAVRQSRPDWRVSGFDISPSAVSIAGQNAVRNSLNAYFSVKDIFASPLPHCDIIVSNPPYVCNGEKATMSHSVLDYEPHSALFVDDGDPLVFYRRIAEQKAAERLYFEINERMGEPMVQMLGCIGYKDVRIINDSYGKNRFVVARMSV